MLRTVSRRNRALFALAGLVALAAAGAAEARAGRGGGFGSRGGRTFDAPAQTQTAPNAARPIERSSQTTPSQIQRPAPAPTPGVGQPAGSRFGGGFFAGLLGAGLLGALFGAGLFGGLGSLASILGFVLQIALIGGLIVLALRFFRRRQQQPALAPSGLSPRSGYGERPVPPLSGMALGGGLPGGARPQPAQAEAPVQVAPQDFDAFERILHEVQDAYNRQDVAALWTLATPEMAGYFQEQLNDNARTGVVDKVSGIKLLQGDLAEAWREGDTDYATVAMRFALTEATVETATGRVVSGNPNQPTEATEIWTFRRDRGGPWKLSAIQQTA